jgi:hypothetical protein
LAVVVRTDLSSIGVDVFGECEAGGRVMDAGTQCQMSTALVLQVGISGGCQSKVSQGSRRPASDLRYTLAMPKSCSLKEGYIVPMSTTKTFWGLMSRWRRITRSFAIGADRVLEECQRLAHLEEKAPEEVFWQRLVVLGVKLRLLPLAKVSKSIVLVEGGAMILIWVLEDIVNRRHYSVAAWNYRNGQDLLGKRVVGAKVDHEHLFDDLMLLVGRLHEERNVVREDSRLFPLTWLPDEGLGGGGSPGSLATATSSSSGNDGFALSHGL